MVKSWKSRAAVFAVAATMAVPLLGMASPAGAAAPGAKDVCKGSGWRSAQTDAGTALDFKNQGACVSYVARGGVVFSPSVTLTLSCDGGLVHFTLAANGFHPGGTGTAQIVLHNPSLTITVTNGSVALDADGNADPALLVNASGSAVVDADATFVDTAGLHAAATTITDVSLNQCSV